MKVKILDQEFEFRLIKVGELKEALRLSEVEMEDFVCLTCVIDSKKYNWDEMLAGIPSKLATIILKESQVTEVERNTLMKECEAWSSTEEGKLEILVMACLKYTPSQISDMTAEEYHKTLIAAQMAAAALHGLDLGKYFNPNKQRKRATMNG